MRPKVPQTLDPHWVNSCDRLPDYDNEVNVLVVDGRSGDIGYAKAKLSKAGWVFTAKPAYSKIVVWIEPDGVCLSSGVLSGVPKDKLRY